MENVKELTKEISEQVLCSVLKSEEFSQVIRYMVETGFYAGARAINKCGDVVDVFYTKEKLVEEMCTKFQKGFK